MKITDPDVIKNGEKDLIDAVKDDLDLDMVKKIIEKRMAASTLSSSGGEIIVHNNEIAFRLDFDIQLSGSLMFDRQGNYISDTDEIDDEKEDSPQDLYLNDLDIEEALEEVGSKTALNETDSSEIAPDAGEDKAESDLIEDALEDENLDINLPDYSLDDDQEDSEQPKQTGQTGPDNNEDDLFDDDISDILKESRDFWEQKKDS